MLTRRQAAAQRLKHERVHLMKAERWSPVRVRGIAPYTIDRVEGTYTVEFDYRTGRSLPYMEWHDVAVVAFDVRHPEGKTTRYGTLREARAAAALLAADRRRQREKVNG